MLSLPMFAFMPRSVQRGFVGLGRPVKKSSGLGGAGVTSSKGMGVHPYTILAFNLISQLICVSGVNQLSSVRSYSNPSYPRAVPFCLPIFHHFPVARDYLRTCLRCTRTVPSRIGPDHLYHLSLFVV